MYIGERKDLCVGKSGGIVKFEAIVARIIGSCPHPFTAFPIHDPCPNMDRIAYKYTTNEGDVILVKIQNNQEVPYIVIHGFFRGTYVDCKEKLHLKIEVPPKERRAKIVDELAGRIKKELSGNAGKRIAIFWCDEI
jgi:hypothetical protein